MPPSNPYDPPSTEGATLTPQPSPTGCSAVAGIASAILFLLALAAVFWLLA